MGPFAAFLLGGIVTYVGRKPIRRAAKRVMKGAIVVGRGMKGFTDGLSEDWEDARAELDEDEEKKARAASDAETSDPRNADGAESRKA